MIEIEEARQYYSSSDAAHDFDHVLRVLALAERIGQAEGAEMEIVRAATLLHDVARAEEERTGACHARAGAERVRQILAGHPADKVEAVAQAIASHRFRDQVAPQTREARVLYDADKLDAIGAIGIARAYALAGKRGQRLWAETPPDDSLAMPQTTDHTPVHEFAFKLSQLKDAVFTTSARQIAGDRHCYLVDFFARLKEEVNGNR